MCPGAQTDNASFVALRIKMLCLLCCACSGIGQVQESVHNLCEASRSPGAGGDSGSRGARDDSTGVHVCRGVQTDRQGLF